MLCSACGGSGASVQLPSGVTDTFLGRVQWAHTRCPHIAENGYSCSFADAVVLAYYAHPSTDFKVAASSTSPNVEMTCSRNSQDGVVTCLPLSNSTNAISFTGPSPGSSG